MAWDLNHRLPEGYFAEPNVQFGIEIDVATWEESDQLAVAAAAGRQAGPSASSASSWTPPQPTHTVPLTLITDIVEVAVWSTAAGPSLAGAIELVSPANKDRREHRRAFVAKCQGYLQEGVGLVVVDIVTQRRAALHAEIVGAASPQRSKASRDPVLQSAAYRPVERDGAASLDIWLEELALGKLLPTLPLWLRGGPCLPVDLEATYEQTRREMRIA
jgi:hypothetical protein